MRSGTVAAGISHVHRSFEARHQTLVGVGGRVGEGAESLGVLDDAADVPEGHLGKSAVFVAGKQVDAVLPDRLVAMHPGAVVAVERFRHEGYGLAVAVGNVLDDVLEPLELVGHVDQ